jgi:hypothetical protein
MLDHLDHTAAAQLVIDPTATASQALTAAGYRDVHVFTCDGGSAMPTTRRTTA